MPDYWATYSPEDNKLRLYASSRLPEDMYQDIKRAGFKWAPKQGLFVAPAWSPEREDTLLGIVDEIEDEDYSPEERAADRAERFEGYRDKRRSEAGCAADTFESGPSAFGHQNRARAERQANRHDRYRTTAVSQWSKAEYWQERTKGVIAHALHKSDARTRRGRLLRLEAEQRKHEKTRQEYATRFAKWQEVLTLDGVDQPVVQVEDERSCGIDGDKTSPAARLAYMLCNGCYGHCWGEYKHPRTGKEYSLYSLMTDLQDPITAAEAARLWLDGRDPPDSTESRPYRWSQHYELLVSYEKTMLENEGGMAAEEDIEPGGWFGRHQVQRVYKSNVTGRVVSVTVMGPHEYKTNADGTPKICQVKINIERLAAGKYRAPTDEERQQFEQSVKERKAAEKASTPKATPLINPTEEDAKRLQDLWNARGKQRHEKAQLYGEYKPTEIRLMTQAEYSRSSSVSHSGVETLEVCTNGFPESGRCERKPGEIIAFKVRRCYPSNGSISSCAPYRIIVITDKPQKPIPLEWDAVEASLIPKPVAAPKPKELFPV